MSDQFQQVSNKGKKNKNRNQAAQQERPQQSAQQPKRQNPNHGQEEEKKAPGRKPVAQASNDGDWMQAMTQAKNTKPQAAQSGFQSRPQTSSHADRGRGGGRGGYNDRGGRGGGAGRGGRGGASFGGARATEGSVTLRSNYFRLNLGESQCVYQYALTVLPDEIFEASIVHEILATKHRHIYRMLGSYAPSGRMIFTMRPIEESVNVETTYKGRPCQIIIDKSTETSTLLNREFVNNQNSVAQAIFNVILKNAFRQTHLKQIGRDPKFFDVNRPITDAKLTSMKLQVLHGFKASCFMSESGVIVAIDSLFRFMSTITCLDKINELKREANSDGKFKQLVEQHVVGSSIIADWGHKRTYIISGIDFTTNPTKMKFSYNEQEITVAEYMHQVYDKAITDFNQPLIIVKHGDDLIHLPPEFCRIDGVPESIRASPGMRDALAVCRVNPDQKMREINNCMNLLMQQQVLKDWDISLSSNPVELGSQRVLAAPQIFKQNQVIHIDENVLRKLPIQKGVDLLKDEWIMVYQDPKQRGGNRRSNYNAANNVYESLTQACVQLGVRVEEPYWIELDNEADMARLEEEIQHYITATGQNRFPKMLLMILGNESIYDKHKQLYKLYQIPSQIVTAWNGNKFNLSKASNVLKQVNSKIGGDLFNLKFPDKMTKGRTMLIGIDVCHAGGNSIVGFVSSYNKEMSQYYSDFLVQKKGQEVVTTQMKAALKKGIEEFAKHHKNNFPTDIIIYRDGVSAAERKQVIDAEVAQFTQACNEMYNQAGVKPKITLVIVNKRIIQNFFIMDGNNRLNNPPSGCIIDRDLVESSGSAQKEFDFFLVPVKGTQGCQRPTHFYVPLNQSALTKIELQQLTFALCHYYFNWAGPIKVPAPCMYAHKIADLYTRIGYSKKVRAMAPNAQKGGQEVIADYVRQQLGLDKKLHFL